MARVPIVGTATGVFDAVALNDKMTGTTTGGNCAVVTAFVAKGSGPTNTPPKGDATIFNDNVMAPFGNANAVDGSVFEFESTNDDVVGIYGDVVIGLVAYVEGGSGFGWGVKR